MRKIAILTGSCALLLLIADITRSIVRVPEPGPESSVSSPDTRDAPGPPEGAAVASDDPAVESDETTGADPAAAPRRMIVRRDLSDPAVRHAYVEELRKREERDLATAESLAAKAGVPRRGEIDGRTYEIAAVRNGRVYVRETRNANAAISTAANVVHQAPYALDGAGRTVAVWDAGSIRATHQEFDTRVTLRNAVNAHTHSTHVGGTIGASGVDADAKGMAPATLIDSYDWTFDASEMASRGMAVPGEAGTIQLSNHSYGFQAGWASTTWFGTWGARESDGFGIYDDFSAELDEVCYNAPYYLPFKAIGNDRNDSSPANGQTFSYFDDTGNHSKSYDPATDPFDDFFDQGGYDTIAYEASAKNQMCVGALNDAVSGGTNRSLGNASMTSFSSWGPTDDGRVKPDIVANGASLYSTSSNGDDRYSTSSGTSMASPNAMGSAALLIEHYGTRFPGRFLRASTLKALIIHTADDVAKPGPDYSTGWGHMNTVAAVRHLDAHAAHTNASRLIEARVTTNAPARDHTFIWDGGSSIRVTIAWTDPAGPPKHTLDDRTPVLVHDLDLRVIAPDGSTNFPFTLSVTNPTAIAETGDNEVDNVEQVLIGSPPAPGVYRAQVSVEGSLQAPDQFYSLLVSGATVPPEFLHSPLANTTNEMDAYSIETEIVSEHGLDTNALFVCWSTAGPAGPFETNPLVRAGNAVYGAEIPAQPAGTKIHYYLEARTTDGLVGREPASAPDVTHAFSVVDSVALLITGSPNKIPGVTPDYGFWRYPSGITVNASSILHSPPTNGVRDDVVGWNGYGSVPPSGTSNAVDFIIRQDSFLAWQWRKAFSLDQHASIPGAVDAESWGLDGTAVQTVAAPANWAVDGTNYALAGWLVDGVRHPDATRATENPAGGIIMDNPRVATAWYLPALLDGDVDGVPDWWEYFYFGSTNVPMNIDLDGDGFTNGSEFRDATNPRDRDSSPTAPSIAHIPVSTPQSLPAPWPVRAVVTDNDAVDTVTLEWNPNGAGWLASAFSPSGVADTFTNVIPAPGVTGDQVQYRIVARDAAGLQAVNGTYTIDVAYPVAVVSPTNFGTVNLGPGGTRRQLFSISNAGHSDLDWTLQVETGGFADDVENGEQAWTHAGVNDVWHITTRRAYSGTHSWYFGNESTGLYPDLAKAWLTSPSIYVPADGVFSFRQWLETEAVKTAVEAWDGAVVEISTDDGATFESLDPDGGYPYVIFGHPESAFTNGTPCLAGTGGWERITFSLADHAGEHIRLRLLFGSDGFVVNDGWFVDDLTVSPYQASNTWVRTDMSNGVAGVSAADIVQVFLDSTDLAPSETRRAMLYVDTNDPLQPGHFVPITLHNIAREIVVTASGMGTVTPPGPLLMLLGESTNFQVEAADYYTIANILTNGVSIGGSFGHIFTNVVWSEIAFTGPGSVHVDFAPNTASGGVTEAWLVLHGLTNGGFDAQALSDQDWDGLSAWEEFIAGTDPTNSESVFMIDTMMPTGRYDVAMVPGTNDLGEPLLETQIVFMVDAHVLKWRSVSNRMYSLHAGSNHWDPFLLLDDAIPATPPLNGYTDTVSGAQIRFYRLGVEFAE